MQALHGDHRCSLDVWQKQLQFPVETSSIAVQVAVRREKAQEKEIKEKVAIEKKKS